MDHSRKEPLIGFLLLFHTIVCKKAADRFCSKFRRRLTGLEMSVFELLAIARETAGVDYVKGDAILCEKRYAVDTDHMLEFRILNGLEPYGKTGDHCRLFLTGEAYRQMREKERQKKIRIIHYARVKENTLAYGPAAVQPASKGE